MSLVPLADTRRKRKLSSGSASLASTETSKSFLNNMPTPRLQKNLYAQYGLVRKILAQSLEAETKFLLHNLMSDSKIMSVFSLVIPYIFLVWFFLDVTDMLRELQLILEIEISGKVAGSLLLSIIADDK